MTERIRGRKGQAIRARQLRSHPLCEHCTKAGRVTLATEVDHITALTNGGDEQDSNRQSLCRACHAIKTAKDMGHVVRPRTGADGWPID